MFKLVFLLRRKGKKEKMNKLFSKIAALSVGLAMAVGVGVALGHEGVREVRADNVTVTPSQFTAVENAEADQTISNIHFECGSCTITSGQFRVFKGQTLKISASGITSIEMTCTASGTTKYGPGCFAAQTGYSYSGYKGTWTGSADSVSFTASSNQVRVTQFVINCSSDTFKVTYKSGPHGSGTMTDTKDYKSGDTVTVGYCSFMPDSGWEFDSFNTAADGSGTKYMGGNQFTISASTTLYAIWNRVGEGNDIQSIYSKSNDAPVDVFGYYVGMLSGTGPVIMNGEYGVVLYNSSADVSSYVEGETILRVTGKVSIFKGLYEIASPSITVVESASYLDVPVTYTVTGNETQIHESRATYVNGVVSSITPKTEGQNWTSDTTVVVTVNEKSINCFAKANKLDSDTTSAIEAALSSGDPITLTGFTGWYNSFQVTLTGMVETGGYTLAEFVSEFLSLTTTECGAEWEEGSDHKLGLEANVWNVLNTASKYQALSPEDKEALRTTEPEKGSDLEKALERYDFLIGKYFGAAGDFLGRGVDFVNGSSYSFSSVNNNNSYIIIIVISAVSVMSFGLALFLRKKRSK